MTDWQFVAVGPNPKTPNPKTPMRHKTPMQKTVQINHSQTADIVSL